MNDESKHQVDQPFMASTLSPGKRISSVALAESSLMSSLRNPRKYFDNGQSVRRIDPPLDQYGNEIPESKWHELRVNSENDDARKARAENDAVSSLPQAGMAEKVSSKRMQGIQAMMQQRRHRHDAAIAEWSSKRKSFYAWAEDEVETIGKEIRATLTRYAKEIQSDLDSCVENVQSMKKMSFEALMEQLNSIQALEDEKLESIEQLASKLDEIETKRAKVLGDDLKTLLRELTDIAHQLPAQIERFVEGESHEMNILILRNRQDTQEALAEIKKQCIVSASQTKARCATIVQQWRELHHSLAVEAFKTLLCSDEFVNPPQRRALFQALQNIQQEVHTSKRLPLLQRLFNLSPPTWHVEMARELLQELEYCDTNEQAEHAKIFSQLEAAHLSSHHAANQHLEQLRRDLHTISALAPPSNLFSRAQKLQAILQDEELQSLLRKSGSVKSTISAGAGILTCETAYNNDALDGIAGDMDTILLCVPLGQILESQGKNNLRTNLLEVTQRMRSCARSQLPSMLTKLYTQLSKLSRIRNLPQALKMYTDTLLQECTELIETVVALLSEQNIPLPQSFQKFLDAGWGTSDLNDGASTLFTHIGKGTVQSGVNTNSRIHGRGRTQGTIKSRTHGSQANSSIRRKRSGENVSVMDAQSGIQQNTNRSVATNSVTGINQTMHTERTMFSGDTDARSTIFATVLPLSEVRTLQRRVAGLAMASDLPTNILDTFKDIRTAIDAQRISNEKIEEVLEKEAIPYIQARETSDSQLIKRTAYAIREQSRCLARNDKSLCLFVEEIITQSDNTRQSLNTTDTFFKQAMASVRHYYSKLLKQREATYASLCDNVRQADTPTKLDQLAEEAKDMVDLIGRTHRECTDTFHQLVQSLPGRNNEIFRTYRAIICAQLHLIGMNLDQVDGTPKMTFKELNDNAQKIQIQAVIKVVQQRKESIEAQLPVSGKNSNKNSKEKSNAKASNTKGKKGNRQESSEEEEAARSRKFQHLPGFLSFESTGKEAAGSEEDWEIYKDFIESELSEEDCEAFGKEAHTVALSDFQQFISNYFVGSKIDESCPELSTMMRSVLPETTQTNTTSNENMDTQINQQDNSQLSATTQSQSQSELQKANLTTDTSHSVHPMSNAGTEQNTQNDKDLSAVDMPVFEREYKADFFSIDSILSEATKAAVEPDPPCQTNIENTTETLHTVAYTDNETSLMDEVTEYRSLQTDDEFIQGKISVSWESPYQQSRRAENERVKAAIAAADEKIKAFYKQREELEAESSNKKGSKSATKQKSKKTPPKGKSRLAASQEIPEDATMTLIRDREQTQMTQEDRLSAMFRQQELEEQEATRIYTKGFEDIHGIPLDPNGDRCISLIQLDIEVTRPMYQAFRASILNWFEQDTQERRAYLNEFTKESMAAYTEELDETLRQLQPRRGIIEAQLRQPREHELYAHEQRLERHRTQFQTRLERIESVFQEKLQTAKDFIYSIRLRVKGLTLVLPEQHTLMDLQHAQRREKQLMVDYWNGIQSKLTELSNVITDDSRALDIINSEFLRTCVLFRDGGDYSVGELDAIHDAVQSLLSQVLEQRGIWQQTVQEITELSESLNAEFESFGVAYDQQMQIVSLREGLGKKYGAPRRISQEKIRTTFMQSEKEAQLIELRLQQLEYLLKCSPGELVQDVSSYSDMWPELPVSEQFLVCIDGMDDYLQLQDLQLPNHTETSDTSGQEEISGDNNTSTTQLEITVPSYTSVKFSEIVQTGNHLERVESLQQLPSVARSAVLHDAAILGVLVAMVSSDKELDPVQVASSIVDQTQQPQVSFTVYYAPLSLRIRRCVAALRSALVRRARFLDAFKEKARTFTSFSSMNRHDTAPLSLAHGALVRLERAKELAVQQEATSSKSKKSTSKQKAGNNTTSKSKSKKSNEEDTSKEPSLMIQLQQLLIGNTAVINWTESLEQALMRAEKIASDLVDQEEHTTTHRKEIESLGLSRAELEQIHRAEAEASAQSKVESMDSSHDDTLIKDRNFLPALSPSLLQDDNSISEKFVDIIKKALEECIDSTKKLFEAEGKLDEAFGGADDNKIPDSLQRFLSSQRSKMDISRDKMVSQLYDQVSRVMGLVQQAAPLVIEDLSRRSLDSAVATQARQRRHINELHRVYLEAREVNAVALAPGLSDPNRINELNTLRERELSRLQEHRQLLSNGLVDLLNIRCMQSDYFLSAVTYTWLSFARELQNLPMIQDLKPPKTDQDISLNPKTTLTIQRKDEYDATGSSLQSHMSATTKRPSSSTTQEIGAEQKQSSPDDDEYNIDLANTLVHVPDVGVKENKARPHDVTLNEQAPADHLSHMSIRRLRKRLARKMKEQQVSEDTTEEISTIQTGGKRAGKGTKNTRNSVKNPHTSEPPEPNKDVPSGLGGAELIWKECTKMDVKTTLKELLPVGTVSFENLELTSSSPTTQTDTSAQIKTQNESKAQIKTQKESKAQEGKSNESSTRNTDNEEVSDTHKSILTTINPSKIESLRFDGEGITTQAFRLKVWTGIAPSLLAFPLIEELPSWVTSSVLFQLANQPQIEASITKLQTEENLLSSLWQTEIFLTQMNKLSFCINTRSHFQMLTKQIQNHENIDINTPVGAKILLNSIGPFVHAGSCVSFYTSAHRHLYSARNKALFEYQARFNQATQKLVAKFTTIYNRTLEWESMWNQMVNELKFSPFSSTPVQQVPSETEMTSAQAHDDIIEEAKVSDNVSVCSQSRKSHHKTK